jgi:tripartite-type tricarboxylate transporter receptor subunit TctC
MAISGSGPCGLAVMCAISIALPALPASAEDYPSRSITIAVPLAAGTGMDVLARIYAEDLAKSLGKPVVVENQPGAALMLPVQNVARAAPDGYTLAVATANVLAVNPTLHKKLSYDAEKDFLPIALYARSPYVMIVNPALGADTMKAFILKAKDGAKGADYATAGTGTLQYLTMESLKRDLKFEARHVPYKNSNQIVTDIVGGHIDSSLSEMGAALSLILDGKVKALAVTTSTRLPALPQVPTMAEALDMPGFEAASWHLLLASSATSRPIVERLHAEMRRITADAGFQKRVSEIGLMPLQPRSIEEIELYIKSERARWSQVVTELGLAGSR